MPSVPDLRSRFAGCLLGQMAGDALGAPFEGLTAELILGRFGRPSEIVEKPPLDKLHFTDDTQMTIALAESLCDRGGLDEDALMAAFAAAYDPARGYGTGARRLLEAAKRGEDWRTLSREMFPGGSYGNGGAMRVAPVGLFFHNDLDRVWKEAGVSASVTHRHPLGIEGAQLLAIAVALAVRDEAANHDSFFNELRSRATQEEYLWLLRMASNLTASDSLGYMGSSLEAHRSVVTSITCFAVAPDSFPKAIARALALGDDTDTLMAMTGAISGAHLGIDAVPPHILNLVENGPKGRDYALTLSHRLVQAKLRQPPQQTFGL